MSVNPNEWLQWGLPGILMFVLSVTLGGGLWLFRDILAAHRVHMAELLNSQARERSELNATHMAALSGLLVEVRSLRDAIDRLRDRLDNLMH